MSLTEECMLSRCRATSLDAIKHVNCWGMALTEVSILQYMTSVEVICLSMNKVDTLKHLADCVRLSELYIRQNNISSMEELHYLAELPDLKVLWLADNPITELSGYRQSVLEILPHLSKLDNIMVQPEEVPCSEEKQKVRKTQRPQSAASVDSSVSEAESIRKTVEAPIVNAITALLPGLDIEGLYVIRGIIDKRIRNAELLSEH